MNRYSLLVISALTLASCQSSRVYTPPRLVGDDMFVINFHGRLSTAPEPLQPLTAEQPIAGLVSPEPGGVAGDGANAATSNDEVHVAVQVVSVPREWVRSTFGVHLKPRSKNKYGPTARVHNARLVAPAAQEATPTVAGSTGVPMLSQIPLVAFLFRETGNAMPVQWWGPRGMRVPAEEARVIFEELRAKLKKPVPRSRRFSHQLAFACKPDSEARVAVTRQMSFVESFEFQDKQNALSWDPGISTAEIGFSLKLLPQKVEQGLSLDYRLQVRDVADVPTAKSRIASSYRHGSNADTLGVTLQAPLFSDHIFEGQHTCGNNDAFVMFATNATAEDEVILALFEVNSGKQKD